MVRCSSRLTGLVNAAFCGEQTVRNAEGSTITIVAGTHLLTANQQHNTPTGKVTAGFRLKRQKGLLKMKTASEILAKQKAKFDGWVLVQMKLEKGWHGVDMDYFGLIIRQAPRSKRKALEKAGVKIYKDTVTALRAAYKFAYPPQTPGMLPHAELSGEFHPKLKVDGLPVFIERTHENKEQKDGNS